MIFFKNIEQNTAFKWKRNLKGTVSFESKLPVDVFLGSRNHKP